MSHVKETRRKSNAGAVITRAAASLDPVMRLLETGVNGFALQGKDSKRALVDPVEWLMPHEALEGLDAESELTHRERSLQSEATCSKALQIVWKGVFGPINDSKVLPAPALHCGLDDPLRGVCDKLERLDHYAFASATGQLFPPARPVLLAGRVSNVHYLEPGAHEYIVIWPGELGDLFHVPSVILVDADGALCRQYMKRRQAQITNRLHGPAVRR